MKATLKLEEAGMMLLAMYLFSLLDYSWWWFLALFLTPDIGMLGYGLKYPGFYLYLRIINETLHR